MVDSINPNTPQSNLYGRDSTAPLPKDQITAAQDAVAAAEAQFAKDGDATAFQTSLQSALAMLPTTSVNDKFDQDVKNIKSLIGQIENDPNNADLAMQENMLNQNFTQALKDIGTSLDAKTTLYAKAPTPQSPKDQITAAQSAVAAAEAQFAKDGDATAFQTSLQSALAMLPTTSVNTKFDQDVKNIKSLIGQIGNDPSGKNVGTQEAMLTEKFTQALKDIGTSLDTKAAINAKDPLPQTPAQQIIGAQATFSAAVAEFSAGGDIQIFREKLNVVAAMLPTPTDNVKFNQYLVKIKSLITILGNSQHGPNLTLNEHLLNEEFGQSLRDLMTPSDAKAMNKSGHKPKH